MHFPQIHPRPTKGWINDPNGIMFYGGRYHLMFQHNPYSARHECIHWGHFSSADLLNWREEPLAVVPRDGFDPLGAWSGVGVLVNNEPHVVYSGVAKKFGESDVVVGRQVQAQDGATFSQSAIAAPMPTEPVEYDGDSLTVTDIRDPFVFEFDGRRLAIQGCGFEDNRAGILLYDASELNAWRLLGPLLVSSELDAQLTAPEAAELVANIFECPQLVKFGSNWVLVVSLWRRLEGGQGSLNGVAYAVGDLAPYGESLKFVAASGGRLDSGPDFYAPQLVPFGPEAVAGDPGISRTLLWGWSWESKDRTEALTDIQGWAGILTLPREVEFRPHTNGSSAGILTVPARELIKLRCGSPRQAASLEVSGATEIVATTNTVISFSAGGKTRTFTSGPEGLRAFCDGSILEVFSSSIQAGGSHTERFYPEDGTWLVTASCDVTAYSLVPLTGTEPAIPIESVQAG